MADRMTDGGTGDSDRGPGDARREARPSSCAIARAVLRIVGSTAALVALYYLLPLDHSSTWAAVTILVIGLVVFIGLVAYQVRSIICIVTQARPPLPFPGLTSGMMDGWMTPRPPSRTGAGG